MPKKNVKGPVLAGISAGMVNGLFGAGGGMVLIPLLTLLSDLKEEELFPSSVTIILPVCIVSLIFSSMKMILFFAYEMLPEMLYEKSVKLLR